MTKNNNQKRALMLIMGALVLAGFGIAQIYYSYDNNSIDPRVLKARELYSNYDTYALNNNFKGVFELLDSVENIYNSIEYYQTSYEIGVVNNNKAAAFLTMAIYFETNSLSLDGINTLSKDSLMYLAEQAVLKSIDIYKNWLAKWETADKSTIKTNLKISFIAGLSKYSEKKQERFIKKRIKEITHAQLETPRRLSVAYTNLGIIKRHQENYEEAIKYYKKALELWSKNLAAENNLNTLLGKPHKKVNILQKIFPPDREE